MSDDDSGCLTFFLILMFSIGGVISCNEKVDSIRRNWAIEEAIEEAEEQKIKSAQKVTTFIMNINIALYKKLEHIEKEELRTEKACSEMRYLRQKYPAQADIINPILVKWQSLNEKLNVVSKEIRSKSEEAYIIYKINEIQGNTNFKQKILYLNKIADSAINESNIITKVVTNFSE